MRPAPVGEIERMTTATVTAQKPAATTDIGVTEMIGIGMALFQAGFPSAAAAIHQSVLDLDPDYPVAQNLLAEALAASGESAARKMDDFDAMETFIFAQQLHRMGKLTAAGTIYGRLITRAPDHANALHFFGVLKFQSGDATEARALIERSLALETGNADWHSNHATVLYDLKDFEGSLAAAEAALAINPRHGAARTSLGNALKSLGRTQSAEKAYRDAVAMDPANAAAHGHLADLLFRTGRMAEAADSASRSIALAPQGSSQRREILSRAYFELGQREAAIAVVRAWLEAEPDNPRPRHMLSSFGAAPPPARADDTYVANLFDAMADSFDYRLAKLGYQAPELCVEAFGRAVGAAKGALAILDLGCGTGLCAPLLRPFARDLDGVDLSGEMLAQARARGGYERLDEAELTAHLSLFDAAYDGLISADTLCYFGRLEEFSAAAFRALKPGGVLVFSLEETEDAEEFVLQPHGRYAHRQAYATRVLEGAGFAPVTFDRGVLRTEKDKPVNGLIVTARRPA